MPFIPDNSVPALDKKDRYKILLDNARKQELITKQEAAKAKKDAGFAATIVRLTGMGKTADTFARYGANKMSSPEAKQFAPMPTRGEMAGAIGNTALMAFPGSTVAKGATKIAGRFLAPAASKLAGSVASLGGAGYGFDVSQNLQEGKTGAAAAAPGLGAALGAVPVVGAGASAIKKGVQKIGAEQAPRIINSLIKPLQKDFAYGKNPGRAVAEEGIKAGSFDELVMKISQSRQKAGQEIGDLGKKLEGKVVLNLQDALLPINDAMETAAKQNNSTLLQRLDSVKRSITENLVKGVDEAGNPIITSSGSRNLAAASFKEAREMMRSIGDVTAFTGNPSDDKLVNSALKRVYGKMKEQTLKGAETADPVIAKMFRKATEKYSDLTSAEIAAKYRDKILERQNMMNFGQTTVGLGGALATAIATGGAAVPTILAGLGAAGLQKALGSTAFKTRIAAWLAKVPASEKASIIQKFPQLQSVMNTRTPGDVFLDSKLGGKVKEGIKSMKGKAGLSVEDVKLGKAGYSDDLFQEARKYESAEEFYNSKGMSDEFRNSGVIGREQFSELWNKANNGVKTALDGAMQHRPTRTGAFASDISQKASDMGIPDFYEHPEWYHFGGKEYDESVSALMKIKDNPDAVITIYRAAPKGELRTGDWVTLSKEKARLESIQEGTKINSFKVRAKDVEFAGDDITEFGYWGKPQSQLTDLYNQATKGETKRGFGTGAGRVSMTESLRIAREKVDTALKNFIPKTIDEYGHKAELESIQKFLSKKRTAQEIADTMDDMYTATGKVMKSRGAEVTAKENAVAAFRKLKQAVSKYTNYEAFLKGEGLKPSDAYRELFRDAKLRK